MSEPNASAPRRAFLPTFVALPIAVLLVLVFVALLFPWQSLGRRIAFEISRGSGARVEVPDLSPAFTARGPVLRATHVTIEHPAVDQVALSELEIAPRLSSSWLQGDPTLRVWARSGLGNVDGVLRLGSEPAYRGLASEVELSRLPLRLDATGLRLSGPIEADVDLALDPNGTLRGRVDFESPSLLVESSALPMALPFSSAVGTVEILQSGATRIDSVALEGPLVEARIDGEVGLVHHSQSPPIDLVAHLRIVEPLLRQMAPGAGLALSPDGEADIRVGGTVDLPEIEPLGAPPRLRGSPGAGTP